jgi:hypothetical protein
MAGWGYIKKLNRLFWVSYCWAIVLASKPAAKLGHNHVASGAWSDGRIKEMLQYMRACS